MGITAQATTNAYGAAVGVHGDLTIEGGGSGDKFDAWNIQTSLFGDHMTISEVRDNLNNSDRVNAFGTLAMFALRIGCEESQICKLGDNKKNVCYDLYVGDLIFRKLNNRHYKRKVRKIRKNV